jgi:threonine/homoserine/homoserine lactone efflux protein
MPSSSIIAIIGFAFAVSIGAVVSPGPVSAAIISEAPRRGWRVGPLIATGHVALELILITLIGLGLTAILASPIIQKVIALAGGLLLLYMGFTYIWSGYKGMIKLPEAGIRSDRTHRRNLIGLGMITTISNPFWYAWWATVVPGYLSEVSGFGFHAIAAFYIGHISADYFWDTFLSVTISAGQRWLTGVRYRILILITGVFMMYLGIVFLRQGFGT